MNDRHGYGPYTQGCRCDVYRAATAQGLVVVETNLLPPATAGRPPLVTVRVQPFAGGRTPYVALYDTAQAVADTRRGRVDAPLNWGGRQAAAAALAEAYVWIVGDRVVEGTASDRVG